jgi:hypothetical protein
MHRYVVVLAFVVALVAMVEIDSALLNTVAQTGTPASGVPALTEDEMQEIIAAAVATAEQTPSLLRVDGAGNHPMTGWPSPSLAATVNSWRSTRWRTSGRSASTSRSPRPIRRLG